ncbi:MAG: alkaline phosphatase [Synechococcales cyanobacterium CRU_2_2]|nr:alkaline phosphatase [Synechococcales cyanobacterium CRU_2_2]
MVSGQTTIEVVDLSDPANPTLASTLDLTIFPGGGNIAGANSVAVSNGLVAVAVGAATVTDNGRVVFFNSSGVFQGQLEVGALPDMLTFTPDGATLLVANEAQSAGSDNEPGVLPNPPGSISVIRLDRANLNNSTIQTAGFTAFDGQEAALRAQGVRIFPGVSASVDFEPEYITVSEDGSRAFVTLQENNAIAVVDIATATVTEIQALGTQDHSLAGNGLDASDRDSGSNIQLQPVRGLYMPDAIASFSANGQTYYITANEGDGRGVSEARVSSLTLDPTAFPDATTLQADGNLGRLTVSSIDGDTDGDGDFDQLFAFGSRSFSIWDGAGNQVFDSGDDFEQILAANFPTLLDDGRSDNKGPEPEGVTVGVIGDRTYAFIGLERASGIMAYDVTNPAEARFIQFLPSGSRCQPRGPDLDSRRPEPQWPAPADRHP